MKAPSDGFLLVLFVLALGVTVASSLVTLQNWGYLGGNFLTGAAVTTAGGEANLTVNAVTSITNQNFTINFGSGYVNASCNFCSMDSNKTFINYFSNGSNPSSLEEGRSCCVSFTEVSSGFLLENTGNTNLSVGYTCTGNCTHALYIGGTLYAQLNTNGWNISNGTAWGGAIAGSGAGLGDGLYVSLSTAGHWLCGNATSYPLRADNTQDAAVIDINVTIPHDAIGTGVRTSFNLTFNATSSA